jgi:hypothetical protein
MSITSIVEKFKAADPYRKRGIVYSAVSLLGMSHEIIFVKPSRPTVLILWICVMGIGVIVLTTLKGPKN